MKLLVLATVGLLALACGTPQQAVQTPDGAANTPRSGGIFNLRVNPDPFDWDITYNGKTQPNDQGLTLSYNSLLGFKYGKDVKFAEMIVRPELAERWEVSPDARRYTFYLRKGVKFANLAPVNGRELTSADVKWSYEYITRSGQFKDKKLPSGQFDYFYEGIESLETPDPYTLVYKFKDPYVPFLSYMASDWNPVMPHEIYDQDGSLKNQIVGTGPYVWDAAASQKGSRTVFKKNPGYWEAGKPYLDEIRQITITNEAAAWAAFQTKQVDLVDSLAYEDAQSVIKNNPQAKAHKWVQPRGYHIYVSQNGNKALQDVRVRKAIAQTIDRDEINKLVAGGQGVWAVPGAMADVFTEAEAKQLQKFDPTEAKQLLAQAGYGNGLTLEWPIFNEESQTNLSWFQLVQAQLKKIGVDVQFKPLDKATQRNRRYAGEFDLDAGVGLGGLEADNDSMLYAVYHSSSTGNYAKVADSELDKLLLTQRQEPNPEKRLGIMRQASKRIIDMAWAVELVYPPKWDFNQGYVQEYYPHFGSHGAYPFVWLNK